jgi:elongation factor G
MKNYTTTNIRNVVLLGHGSSGKTTLAEAMLFLSKGIDRFGNINDGNTTCDYDPEEIRRKFSINTSIAPVLWKNHKLNILDTPGYFDFEGEVKCATRAAEIALILLTAKNGIEVGTEKAWSYADEVDISRAFFVTKLEEEHADFFKVVEDLKEQFGNKVLPFHFPIMEDGEFKGIIDIVYKKAYIVKDKVTKVTDIPAEYLAKTEELREPIMEAVAETEEELMEKYFEGEHFTDEEIIKGLTHGIEEDSIFPVFCGSSMLLAGIDVLMDELISLFPSPAAYKVHAVKAGTDEQVVLNPSSDEKFAGLVFKTMVDAFVGKISLIKVCSGELKSDMTVINSRTMDTEKMSNLFFIKGKKQEQTEKAVAGDIVAVAKLTDTQTNDTLSLQSFPLELKKIDFPQPSISLAVEPLAKGDEDKIGSGLSKLSDEDPTFRVENNPETKQLLISGLGEQHIDVITSKLKAKYGVSVKLTDPKIPYRETIKKKLETEGKHKKQSGGHGQYGDVKIRFEPADTDFEFEEEIFGGSVPKSYIPAVEKGLRECLESGVLAGYPVVNVKAVLYDGSYHEVDSSEMAFKIAASLAFRKGMEEANPVLLEPIVKVEVMVPEDYMGDVMGDLNKRRGRILGMEPQPKGMQLVIAEAPQSEMFKYATDLRSMTQARGNFSMEFMRYEEAPQAISEKVIEAAKEEEK